MIRRWLKTNKVRNVAKFFAHLLGTDGSLWHVLAYMSFINRFAAEIFRFVSHTTYKITII